MSKLIERIERDAGMRRLAAFLAERLAPHLSLFALCSQGRDREERRFELAVLVPHMAFYVGALRAFLGASAPLRVAVTDFQMPVRMVLLEALIDGAIGTDFDNVAGGLDQARSQAEGFYLELCFDVHAPAQDGGELELADGGAVDRTQCLLSNATERLIISGSERVCSALIR